MIEPAESDLGSRTGVKFAFAAVAGFVVLVLLLPWSGIDTDPPICYSMFNYSVPCGSGLALAAGVTTGLVVLGFLLMNHRRSIRNITPDSLS